MHLLWSYQVKGGGGLGGKATQPAKYHPCLQECLLCTKPLSLILTALVNKSSHISTIITCIYHSLPMTTSRSPYKCMSIRDARQDALWQQINICSTYVRLYDEVLMVSQGVESECWSVLHQIVPRNGLQLELAQSIGKHLP